MGDGVKRSPDARTTREPPVKVPRAEKKDRRDDDSDSDNPGVAVSEKKPESQS